MYDLYLYIRDDAFYGNADDNAMPNFSKKQGHIILNLPYYTNIKWYID